jgi:hypothetical protein
MAAVRSACCRSAVRDAPSPPSKASAPRLPAQSAKAWLDVEVIQCGYCQSGQIIGVGSAGDNAQSGRLRHRCRHGGKHLPLWHLCAHSRCH